MTERKTIPDWPDYEASDDGVIRNKNGRVCKQFLDRGQYYAVAVSKNKKWSKRYVHNLMCRAFYGLPQGNRKQAAHNNGIKTHNHISNLRWATNKENYEDMVMHGSAVFGSRSGTSKLTDDQVIAILKELRTTPKCKSGSGRFKVGALQKIADRYGLRDGGTIGLIANGTNWRHLYQKYGPHSESCGAIAAPSGKEGYDDHTRRGEARSVITAATEGE